MHILLTTISILIAVFSSNTYSAEISREDFSRVYSIPDLVTARLRSSVQKALVDRLIRDLRIKETNGALSAENIKRTLTELDKIVDNATRDFEIPASADRKRIEDAFFAHGGYDLTLQPPASIKDQLWIDNSVKEIVSSARLNNYIIILATFSEKSLIEGLLSRTPADIADYQNVLSIAFSAQHEVLRHIGRSKWTWNLLPNNLDIQALINLSQSNTEHAKLNGFVPDPQFDKAIQLVAQQSSLESLITKVRIAEALESLKLLVSRVSLVLDRSNTGRCSELEIDPISAAASKGNWATTKTSLGGQIKRGSFEHLRLVFYYKMGCSGNPDFKTARKVMEDISATPYDYENTKPGLRSDVRHCELARWARYGVGGERSEALAREYENRFRSEAWMIPISPTAKDLRDLVTSHPRYEQAAYGFLCPPDRVIGGIDPRNPWEDLK